HHPLAPGSLCITISGHENVPIKGPEVHSGIIACLAYFDYAGASSFRSPSSLPSMSDASRILSEVEQGDPLLRQRFQRKTASNACRFEFGRYSVARRRQLTLTQKAPNVKRRRPCDWNAMS